jgi:hypothetical protein
VKQATGFGMQIEVVKVTGAMRDLESSTACLQRLTQCTPGLPVHAVAPDAHEVA